MTGRDDTDVTIFGLNHDLNSLVVPAASAAFAQVETHIVE
jgi:hypothetical protein